MENELIDLCPICIENPATYYTECGHCYCIGCLSRIKKCAMCRNPLQKAKLCIEIKSNKRNRTDILHQSSTDSRQLFVDFVYLDSAERRRLGIQSQSYTNNDALLIQQLGMAGLAYST